MHASVPDGSCLTSSGVDDSIRAAAWIGRSVSARRCGRRGTGGARVHDRRRRDRLRWQEYFFPPRGGFNVRCTRERYIPKNVFFLREEVLIYDAPSLSRKDNRFDQELPSIRGSKVWRKGSRPVPWLDGMVEVLVSDNKG